MCSLKQIFLPYTLQVSNTYKYKVVLFTFAHGDVYGVKQCMHNLSLKTRRLSHRALWTESCQCTVIELSYLLLSSFVQGTERGCVGSGRETQPCLGRCTNGIWHKGSKLLRLCQTPDRMADQDGFPSTW